MKSTILVTGGAGFIGSNFISYFLNEHPNISILNLDKLTYASDLENLKSLNDNPNYQFIKGSICNPTLLESIFSKYQISNVIHFAADSHVDNAIIKPDTFIQTNIFGTFNLLEVARKYWMTGPFEFKKNASQNRFLHVSTDEVYGSSENGQPFTEKSPYLPNNPYSASKASSDMIVRSYFRTYGLNVVTTNCSNNYGPKQHHEKLIPTVIRKALSKKNIPIYGDGTNIRDWLFVEDHCKAIDMAYHFGISGESYNIGGGNELSNIEIAKAICLILDKIRPIKEFSYQSLISFVKDRPGHDKHYAIDCSKIKDSLHWHAKEDFDTGIKKTINWYLNKYNK